MWFDFDPTSLMVDKNADSVSQIQWGSILGHKMEGHGVKLDTVNVRFGKNMEYIHRLRVAWSMTSNVKNDVLAQRNIF